MDAVLPYRAMAYNNGWANHRLLSACTRLSQAEFVATRVGFFPSLRATLNHILIIDRFYVDAIEGGMLGPAAWSDPEPYETAVQLRDAQGEMDRRLIAFVERFDAANLDDTVEINRGDRIQRERLDRVLLHLLQHQIHHRGQAHNMLNGTAVPPPQLDEFFAIADAPLRAAEFAELGWTEDTIWSRPG
ncbi:MAG TPA: DinB family protein [Steroidobacteraceae bacterium]|nr:DinB family protein [Steroidobacteraceae bacterium]